MTSFVGSDIADTCFGFPDGQLVGVGGAGAAAFKITADGTEVADVWPSALLATVLALAPQPGGRGSPSSGAGLDAAGASPSPQTRANDR